MIKHRYVRVAIAVSIVLSTSSIGVTVAQAGAAGVTSTPVTSGKSSTTPVTTPFPSGATSVTVQFTPEIRPGSLALQANLSTWTCTLYLESVHIRTSLPYLGAGAKGNTTCTAIMDSLSETIVLYKYTLGGWWSVQQGPSFSTSQNFVSFIETKDAQVPCTNRLNTTWYATMQATAIIGGITYHSPNYQSGDNNIPCGT